MAQFSIFIDGKIFYITSTVYLVPGHISLKCNINAVLFQVKSTYLRNIFQCPTLNCKFDFSILCQALNN